jgi:hypothetical protein
MPGLRLRTSFWNFKKGQNLLLRFILRTQKISEYDLMAKKQNKINIEKKIAINITALLIMSSVRPTSFSH